MKILLMSAAVAMAALSAGARAQESKVFDLGRFDRIEVSGVARVDLSQGDKDQVTVMGGGETPRGLQMEVAGGELRLHTTDSWKFWSREPVQVAVQVRELKRIGISGASEVRAPRAIKTEQLSISISGEGNVRMADITAGTLRFDISGAGDGDLAGHVGELRLSVSGKGKLQADRLRADSASVAISGIGNAEVWAVEQLRVSVSGIGTVNYWGSPQVKRASSGMATINAMGERK